MIPYRLDAGAQQKVQRGAHAVDAHHVGAAALEAARRVVPHEVEVVPLLAVDHRGPSRLQRSQVLQARAAHVQHADAERTEQPLVGIGHGEVHAPGLQVGGHHPEALDDVGAQQGSGVVTHRRQAGQVGAPTPCELDPARGHHLGRRPGGDGLGEGTHGQAATGSHRRHQIDHHTLVPQPQPGVDRGRELQIGHHHPVTLPPCQSVGHEAQPFGGVLHEGHVVGRNAHEGRRTGPHLLGPLGVAGIGQAPVAHEVSGASVLGVQRRSREGRDAGVVQVSPTIGDGEVGTVERWCGGHRVRCAC